MLPLSLGLRPSGVGSTFGREQVSLRVPHAPKPFASRPGGLGFWERSLSPLSRSAALPLCSDPCLNLLENNRQKNKIKGTVSLFSKSSQGAEHKEHFTCQYCLLLGGLNVNLMFSQAVADGFSWTTTYPWTL